MEREIGIKFITTAQTYPLRNMVLRPNKPVESVFLEHDDDVTTFHLGALLDSEVIGVGSFHKVGNPNFSETIQYQLRKMATSPDYRKINAGRKLIEAGIEELNKRKVELLWCNAREAAIGFYEKLGLKVASDFFDVPGIGPHKLMFIRLIP